MVYTTIGLSICLGLSLVLVHTTKIYMDEGGVRYYYGSFVMKQAGGYAYRSFSSTFNVANCCEKSYK